MTNTKKRELDDLINIINHLDYKEYAAHMVAEKNNNEIEITVYITDKDIDRIMGLEAYELNEYVAEKLEDLYYVEDAMLGAFSWILTKSGNTFDIKIEYDNYVDLADILGGQFSTEGQMESWLERE
jgi:hypothetical protein